MTNIHNKYQYKDEQGIIPSIIKPLLDKRKETKRQMKNLNRNSREYKTLDTTQYAQKVIANAFYGVLGFPHFRLYNSKVAESVTYIARTIIKEVIRWFEEKGFEVIYSDTDSVFISMKDKTIDDMEKLKNELNLYFKTYFKQFGVKDENNIFEIEFEKVYDTLFFKLKSSGDTAKKRYAGKLIWKDGKNIDEFHLMGFESRRSDSPQIGRDFMRDVLKKIVYKTPKEEIDNFVEEFRNKILNGEFSTEELGLPMGLSKDPNKYANTIHARASRIANQKHNAQIKQGDKIKYVYLKNDDVIAFKNYMYDGYVIDYEKMCRRICDMKIKPLYDSLGWDWKFEEEIVIKIKKERKIIKSNQMTL